MKIVLTLLVRDEIDVISENLKYHLAEGVDHIIVTDNGSQDGTKEILDGYQASGQITLFHEPPADFSQHRWVTRMARYAYDRFQADWVINADADEFFVWRQGSLRQALERIPAKVHRLRALRTDFVPFTRPERQSPVIEMIYRKTKSLGRLGRELTPKIVHRGAPDVIISQGNHRANSGQFRGRPQVADIAVYHYPVRNYAQFESKVRNGGSGYAQNLELPAGTGGHKRRWYDLLLRHELEHEYYGEMFFDENRLTSALARGELTVDKTVAERLEQGKPLNASAAATGQ